MLIIQFNFPAFRCATPFISMPLLPPNLKGETQLIHTEAQRYTEKPLSFLGPRVLAPGSVYQYLLLVIFFTISHSITNAQQPVTVTINKTGTTTNITRYLTEKSWNELFPNRYAVAKVAGSTTNRKKKDFYSFKAFKTAAAYFPQFLAGEDTIMQKRELCAFLANMAYETGGGWDEAPGGYYQWGLYFVEERGCEKGCLQYSDPAKPNYPPADSQSYHGRGPLQISWNYNYGQFSEAYFGNKETLLNNPAMVASDPVLTFASALWFWTTPQYPKPSCHAIMNNSWKPTDKDIAGGRLPGFGAVVNVINGGIECGKETSANTSYRYGYYAFFCRYFHVSPGENSSCTTQKPFGQ